MSLGSDKGTAIESLGSSYEHELRVALALARDAGRVILEYYNTPLHVEQKKTALDAEPVTEADRASNALIVSGIRFEFPEDGILAEESIDTARRLGKRRVWMIDPLDGTKGFIARGPDFAVQIGLAVDGESQLGVVYQPLPRIMYWAARGAGAWVERPGVERERARVTIERDVTRMRMAESRSHRSPRMDRVVSALGISQEVQRNSVGVKVGLLVERQCDLYIHLSSHTKQWDTCAPEAILREAGGQFTDLFGQSLRYNSPDVENRNGIVATNGAAHDHIIEQLAPLLVEFGRERV
ncbi:MAG TPA: 3'(2'),5'-bisphosphate nucleotidase CysQ [Pyrinomonadaceae bacterium]|jgi:3'(2'), 5'-bisphosphate nucleotidase